jgi:ribulose-5-phosphate 4-epimerase/fuculose-1-phosphate aldolase
VNSSSFPADMTERYTGPKFETLFRTRMPVTDRRLSELGEWCKRFSDHGLAPPSAGGFAGNMSIRTERGLIISAAGADLGHMQAEDFVRVLEVDMERRRVLVEGLKESSSESLLHQAIYRQRPEVNAVFHGHDDVILRQANQLSLPITVEEQPYGTIDLMEEVLRVLGDHLFVVIRKHGFLAMGKSMDQAGTAALRHHDRAQAQSRSAL